MNQSTRRDFLKISIAGLGSFFFAFPTMPFAAGAAANTNFPREIGTAFLRARGSQTKAMQIKQAIEKIKTKAEMQAFIEKSIDDDYQLGAYFSYNCWQLSYTEGALCALYGS